jgi:excisionase family DNA binding protein
MNQEENDIWLTTPQAAERLGVTTARVRQLILAGRLPSRQFGRDHLVKESDLALVADRRPGRPSLTDEEKAQRAAAKGAGLPFAPPATVTKPKTTARAKKTGLKKAAKKGARAK